MNNYPWFSPLSRPIKTAREKMVENLLETHDDLTFRYAYSKFRANRSALHEIDENDKTFKDLLEANKLYLGADEVLHQYYINKNLRTAINLIMETLYSYCPVDTGFGVSQGIRYQLTQSGAKIIIGRGIADYLVHLSYPRSDATNVRGESAGDMSKKPRGGKRLAHRHWIDYAIAEARPKVKQFGFKLMKDHLYFGSMQLYLVSYYKGSSIRMSIMTGYTAKKYMN